MLTGSKTDGCRRVQNVDDSSRLDRVVTTRSNTSRLDPMKYSTPVAKEQTPRADMSKPKHDTRILCITRSINVCKQMMLVKRLFTAHYNLHWDMGKPKHDTRILCITRSINVCKQMMHVKGLFTAQFKWHWNMCKPKHDTQILCITLSLNACEQMMHVKPPFTAHYKW